MNTTTCTQEASVVSYLELTMVIALSLERLLARVAKLFRKKTKHTQTIHVAEHSPSAYGEDDRVTTIELEESR